MKQLHDVLIAWCIHSNVTDLSLYNIYVCFFNINCVIIHLHLWVSFTTALKPPPHLSFASSHDRKTTPVSCKRTECSCRIYTNERSDHFLKIYTFFWKDRDLSSCMFSIFSSTVKESFRYSASSFVKVRLYFILTLHLIAQGNPSTQAEDSSWYGGHNSIKC